jgi:uncharacterized protein YukE
VLDPKPTANPAELEAAARRLRSEADALDKAVAPYQRAAAGSEWRGQAADQLRSDAGKDQTTATNLAGQLRQIAAQLDNGAAEIRRYLAELERQRRQQQQRAKVAAR